MTSWPVSTRVGNVNTSAAVVAQICHIYAASDNGPRGKPGLTATERNSPDNLILMCGHHHPEIRMIYILDKDWMIYLLIGLTASPRVSAASLI